MLTTHSLCDGDPLCVKFCPTGALLYLSSEKVSIKLRIARVDRFLETQLPHPKDKVSTIKIVLNKPRFHAFITRDFSGESK